MNTEFSEIYELFEALMQDHPDYFDLGVAMLDLTDKEIIKVINKKNLMTIKSTLPILQAQIVPQHDISFTNVDYDAEEFLFELNSLEKNLVAEAMRITVLKDGAMQLAETKLYVKGDIKTYSPNEGRKTYMNDFLQGYKRDFKGLITAYNLRIRGEGAYIFGY
jgi:hypothetical protein